jgi:transposase-like protein
LIYRSSLGAETYLQPAGGTVPNHVAVDETVIQLSNEQLWLYVAVDSATNHLIDVKLSSTRNQATTEISLTEIREKHLVDDAVFLVNSALQLQATLHSHGLGYRHQKHTNHNNPERILFEIKRRTSKFPNCFSHAKTDTVENWFQVFAFAWNQLI